MSTRNMINQRLCSLNLLNSQTQLELDQDLFSILVLLKLQVVQPITIFKSLTITHIVVNLVLVFAQAESLPLIRKMTATAGIKED